MNKYEMLYIIDSSITDEARDAVISKFEAIITSDSGKVLSIDKWGVKKLAYPINDKNDGFYVLMTFEAQPTLIAEIERVANITVEVMRRLVTRL
jgi:small subunit ribosomal protein S6